MIAKHAGNGSREWRESAIRRIEADFNRSSDTHLIRVDIPALDGIHLYMKDESTHPTGSLKHRLARSLFLYALCNGWITEHTPIIEASSGSTAVSEAHFARLLALRFIAVVPRATSSEKIELIKFNGGTCHFVDEPAAIYQESRRLAAELGGHFMDQFTYAERATDWRGNNNIAQSIFEQMAREPHPGRALAAHRQRWAATCATVSIPRGFASSTRRARCLPTITPAAARPWSATVPP